MRLRGYFQRDFGLHFGSVWALLGDLGVICWSNRLAKEGSGEASKKQLKKSEKQKAHGAEVGRRSPPPPFPPTPAEPPRRTPRAESLLKLCVESLLMLCVEFLLKVCVRVSLNSLCAHTPDRRILLACSYMLMDFDDF